MHFLPDKLGTTPLPDGHRDQSIRPSFIRVSRGKVSEASEPNEPITKKTLWQRIYPREEVERYFPTFPYKER